MVLTMTLALAGVLSGPSAKRSFAAPGPVDPWGLIGVGYWGYQDVSVRYWLTSRISADIGMGLQINTGAHAYSAHFGANYALARFNTLLLEGRPEANIFNQLGYFGGFGFKFSLLGEWFVPGSDNHLSISAGPGLGIQFTKNSNGESRTVITSGRYGMFTGALHLYF
mgnify:FL=1